METVGGYFWLKACGDISKPFDVLGSSTGKYLRFPLCALSTFPVHVKFGEENKED
jgi:hypothetical protein